MTISPDRVQIRVMLRAKWGLNVWHMPKGFLTCIVSPRIIESTKIIEMFRFFSLLSTRTKFCMMLLFCLNTDNLRQLTQKLPGKLYAFLLMSVLISRTNAYALSGLLFIFNLRGKKIGSVNYIICIVDYNRYT
jgi:hypothetical protein